MDHFPQIAEDFSLRGTELRPTGNRVLLEANIRETMVGSLYVPLQAIEAYPTSGWVYAIGLDVQENLRVGDFVLIEEEGMAVDQTYYDVFEITIRHDNGLIESIFAEIEVEPVLREQVEKYRRGYEDNFLRMQDKKNGGSIGFNCSNVLSWQFGEIANPSYDLTYMPTEMFVILNEYDVPSLFYLIDERKILATVEYPIVDTRGANPSPESDRDREAATTDSH